MNAVIHAKADETTASVFRAQCAVDMSRRALQRAHDALALARRLHVEEGRWPVDAPEPDLELPRSTAESSMRAAARAREALDAWKIVDGAAAAAEKLVAEASLWQFQDLVPAPLNDLISHARRLRSVANDQLTLALKLIKEAAAS